MPPAPSQQQQSGDNSLAPLWIVVGLFMVGWLLWGFFHTQVVSFLLIIKGVEARLIAVVLPRASSLSAEIGHLPPDQVAFSQLLDISRGVGRYLRYPVILILGILALVVYRSHIHLRFKRAYSMKSLAQAERNDWPQISPVIDLNLVTQDIDKGPWAMALSPMQFAEKYGLLHDEKTIATGMTMAARVGIQVTAKIRQEAAYQVFASQLGEYWQGTEHLTPATKALFVIFAARIDRDKEGALKLLRQIAESAAAGQLDFSGVDTLWEQHKNNKTVHRIIQSHAYVLTVMASMLVASRKEGVLASADFLWLKPTDRTLWFMLNSVGRQSVFSEVAGPFAHGNVEHAMRRRLLMPMVEEAVNGLDAAIKDILYVPDSERE